MGLGICYNLRMRTFSLFGALAAFASLLASAAPLSSLPAPAFADSEVSVCHSLDLAQPGVRGLDVALSFAGTPSNNVEIAFGHDVDGDGELAFDETGIRFGWDCGRRFVERVRTGERFEEAASGNADGTVRTLRWDCAVRRRALRGLCVSDGADRVFPSLAATPPDWVYDPNWDTMRLTARGIYAPTARFDVEVTATGLSGIFR